MNDFAMEKKMVGAVPYFEARQEAIKTIQELKNPFTMEVLMLSVKVLVAMDKKPKLIDE